MARKQDKTKQNATAGPRLRLPRGRALLALLVVAALGWGGFEVWQRVAPLVAQSPRFLITADRIELNDPPVWIVGDIRDDVIRDAGLDGRLSILDDRLFQRVRDAFLLNPWIESVDRVEKSFPAGVKVQATYRNPVAVVELPDVDGRRLVPIDAAATHLPEQDVPENRRHWLPRIVGIVGEPPLGRSWEDPRVSGAVELAVGLAPYWDAFYLSEIVPSARQQFRSGAKFFEFELVTRGGTRIVWGAAPGQQAPNEATFETKLLRLREGVEKVGPLNTVRGPKTVNVRDGLHITPRSARKPPSPKEPVTSLR